MTGGSNMSIDIELSKCGEGVMVIYQNTISPPLSMKLSYINQEESNQLFIEQKLL